MNTTNDEGEFGGTRGILRMNCSGVSGLEPIASLLAKRTPDLRSMDEPISSSADEARRRGVRRAKA